MAVALIGVTLYLGTHSTKFLFKAVAGEGSVSLPASGTYPMDQEIEVPINLSAGENNVIANEIVVTYPADLLKLNGEQVGPAWVADAYGDPLKDAPVEGKVDRLIGASTPVSGDANLTTLKFLPLKEGTGTISIMQADSVDNNLQMMNVTKSEPMAVTVGNPPQVGNINLKISLQGRTDFTHANVSMEVYNLNDRTTPLFSKNDIATDASGAGTFQITGVADGSYDFRVKVPGYLSQTLINNPLSNASGATLTYVTLKAGDINNDNSIDGGDFTTMKIHWATADELSDINKDGDVNGGDFTYIKMNWNEEGN